MDKNEVIEFLLKCMGSDIILDELREYLSSGGKDILKIKEMVFRDEDDIL